MSLRRPVTTRQVADRLLTTRDVAERLRVAPATVLRWRRNRGLPSVELTRRATRYWESELEPVTLRREGDVGASLGRSD
jgi:transcriptional regulator with XRE-family HTH domain